MWNFKKQMFKTSEDVIISQFTNCECYTLTSLEADPQQPFIGLSTFIYTNCETDVIITISVLNNNSISVCSKDVPTFTSGDPGYIEISQTNCCIIS